MPVNSQVLDRTNCFLVLARKPKFVGNAAYDFRQHEALVELKAPLTHVIYVERSRLGIYGIVRLFGGYQFYCVIGPPVLEFAPAALKGTLDPVSGNETFQPVDPLGIGSPFDSMAETLFHEGLASWAERIRNSAISCGAPSEMLFKYNPPTHSI